MKQMLKTVFASLVLGLAVQPVQAADLEVSDGVSADAWTGFYVGGGISVSSPDIKNRPETFGPQSEFCVSEACTALAVVGGATRTPHLGL